MYAESAAEYERLQQITGGPLAGLAVTYARMGKTEPPKREVERVSIQIQIVEAQA